MCCPFPSRRGGAAFAHCTSMKRSPPYPALLWVLLLLTMGGGVVAQTPVDVHRNKYTPEQDVQLGREAAAQIERELPILRDEQVNAAVEEIGRRLVAALPPERRVSEFRYTFTVVNQKELNAFALPGGPIYINRGMLETSKTEGEAAGVLAHELAHVVLRHGTAQATAATKFQVGQVAGQILGAIVGGRTGSVIAQGSDVGLGTYFLKYSREFERESDLLGAQIVARAGYDPREMAQMFRTLQSQGGSRAPEWMSTHPDPGNRYQAITREAELLRVENPTRSTSHFVSLQARLRALPAAPSRSGTATTSGRAPGGGNSEGTRGRVELPSSQYRQVEADIVRLAVPANWQQDASEGHLTFAPAGAVYQAGGANGFTHGVQVGVVRTQSPDLATATQELLQLFARSNPDVRSDGTRRDTLAGQQALTTRMRNVSEATRTAETISLSTTQLQDGSLLYVLGVAPQAEFRAYDPVFQRVRQSLQITR